jgi:2,3-diketo-5-methylthio-1-phosphopentane phosphatase
MPWNILCDFDGTVVPVDVSDALFERFAEPAWRDIEAEWQADRLTSRVCMERQVALLRCSRAELDGALDAIDIDPGFTAFVADCRRWGHSLSIVSDGLDYAVERIFRRHAIHNVAIVANHLRPVGDRRYALEFPYASRICGSGVCKCSFRESADPTLVIGDGRSDFCVAGAADMVIAKGSLLDHCRRDGLPVIPFDDFAQVRAAVDRLGRRQPRRVARTPEWSTAL